MTIVYGVDTDKPVSPHDVRDAIVACFVGAHASTLEDLKNYSKTMSAEEFERMKQINVQQLIRGFFSEVGGNFEEPTRASILGVMEKLKIFASNFRDSSTIEKHYNDINQLVNKLT